MELSYQEVLEELRKGICRVDFEKANGEARTMYGTRSPEIISQYVSGPKKSQEELEKQRIRDEETGLVRIFDMEKKQWRSFHFHKILKDIEGNNMFFTSEEVDFEF